MKAAHKILLRNILISGLFLLFFQLTTAQTIPAVMDTASMEEQMAYMQSRFNIYEGFRAVREDVFQKMKGNVLDTLSKEKLDKARLQSELEERDNEIRTLNADLERTGNERDQAIRTKDSFSFLGLQMQKGLYNSIMWIVVLVLAGTGIILFLMFKRSNVVTVSTKKELENVQDEYEQYRNSSREKYEKLVISHHNEIMKLKRS